MAFLSITRILLLPAESIFRCNPSPPSLALLDMHFRYEPSGAYAGAALTRQKHCRSTLGKPSFLPSLLNGTTLSAVLTEGTYVSGLILSTDLQSFRKSRCHTSRIRFLRYLINLSWTARAILCSNEAILQLTIALLYFILSSYI